MSAKVSSRHPFLGGGFYQCTKASPHLIRTCAGRVPKEGPPADAAEAKARRLSRLLEKYQDADLNAQELKPEAYAESRTVVESSRRRPVFGRRAVGGYIKRKQDLDNKHVQMFYYDASTGKDQPNVGYYGDGKPQWWALSVIPGREKQVMDSIHRLLPSLPLLRRDGNGDKINSTAQSLQQDIDEEAEGDDQGEKREAETWSPAKRVRVWSAKTGKMGNRSLKYGDGGWVMVKTVMDHSFAVMLKGNTNVLGFRDREVFNNAIFPRPAAQEVLDALKAWEEDVSDVTEEHVRAELGLPEPKAESASWLDESQEEGDYAKGGRFGKRELPRGGRGRGGGRMSGLFTSQSSEKRSYNTKNNSRYDDAYETGSGGGGGGGGGWYTGSGDADPLGFDGASYDAFADGDGDVGGWFEGAGDSLGGLLTDDDDDAVWGSFESEELPSSQESQSSMRSTYGSGISGAGSNSGIETPANDPVVDDGTWGTGGTFGVGEGGNTNFGTWFNEFDDPFTAKRDLSASSPRTDTRGDQWGGARGGQRRDQRTASSSPNFSSSSSRERAGPHSRSRGDNYGNNREPEPERWARRSSANNAFEGDNDLSWWDLDDTSSETADQKTSGQFGGKDADGFTKMTASEAPYEARFDRSSDAQERYDDAAVGGSSQKSSLASGMAVEVVAGPFKDFEGVVLESKGGKVRAEIDVFGKKTVVEVGEGDVASISMQ